MESWREYLGILKEYIDKQLAGRNGSFCKLDDDSLTVYFRGPDGETQTAIVGTNDKKRVQCFDPDRMADMIFRRGMEFVRKAERDWRIRRYNEERKKDGIR